MANIASYGFQVHQSLVADHVRPLEFNVADAYQAAVSSGGDVDLGVGDVVQYAAAGGVSLADGAETTPDVPYGVIVGVKQYFDGLNNAFRDPVPGGSTGSGVHNRRTIVQVIPLPWALWSAEADDATLTTLAAYEGLIHSNVSHINTEGVTNRATPKIDRSSTNTTATLGFRVVGVDGTLDANDYSATGVRLIVAANTHSFAGAAATPIVGV